MTLASDLIAETQRHVYAGSLDQRNKLSAPFTAGGTTLSFTYDLGKLAKGTLLEIDLELFYVWSVDATAKTAVVDGAQLGSTPANHSTAALVTVSPKFPQFSILKALNEDLYDLSSPANGLFQVKTVDIAYNASLSGYDLTASVDPLSIVDLRYKSGASDAYWPPIRDYEISRNMATTEFASGTAVFLIQGGMPGQTIRVKYRGGFSPLVNTTDDVLTVAGLPLSAHDIPPLGAAVRLVAGREIKRNFTESQGQPRRADEVQPGAIGASAKQLSALRQQRIAAESARLVDQYPIQLRRS